MDTRSVTKLLLRLVALVSLVRGTLCAAELPEPAISWTNIGSGLEQANFRINPDSILSASVVVVRSDLRTHRVGVIRASEFGWKHATVQALCKASGATVCINANFFDEQGKPLGLVISRGIMHQKTQKGGSLLTGILFATPKTVGISHRDTFNPEGVVEAVQAGPRLLSQGQIVEGIKASSRSTNLSGICIDDKNRVSLFRVTAGVFGSSLPQVQNILTTPELRCVEALNFDGGGSSSMYIAGEIAGHAGAVREENFPGLDEVPTAIGFFSTLAQAPAVSRTTDSLK